MARSGPNFAVNTLANYAFETSREHWMGYIYTDRPVYRPGHTVHFKGILRLRGAAGYDVPAGKPLLVEIQDHGTEAGLPEDAHRECERDDSRRSGAAGERRARQLLRSRCMAARTAS